MARLIDADKAIFELGIEDWEIDCKHFIDEQPTVDAAPVVHGEWIVQNSSYTKFKCYACGSEYHERRWDYCPMCGAKMDGGDKE